MIIPRSVFRLHKATDPDSQRYALDNVLFERGANNEPYAVATDGRFLVVATWVADASTLSEDVLLPVAACEAALQWGQDAVKMRIAANGNVVLTLREGAEYSCPPGEGRFPKWREVLDSITHDDSEVLAGPLSVCQRRIDIIAAILQDDEGSGMTLTIPSQADHPRPLVFAKTTADLVRMLAVLMPRDMSEPDGDLNYDWRPGPKWQEELCRESKKDGN